MQSLFSLIMVMGMAALTVALVLSLSEHIAVHLMQRKWQQLLSAAELLTQEEQQKSHKS